MKRLYDDPEMEAASLMAWMDRRLEMATSKSSIRLYYTKFNQMWHDSFGTLDTVPIEYRDKVIAKYMELRKGESK